MSFKTALIYSEDFKNYDFGPSHPLRPIRFRIAYELLRAYGITSNEKIIEKGPRAVSDDDILLVHDKDYVEHVKNMSGGAAADEEEPGYGLSSPHGIGPGDNPPFIGMYDASAIHIGATLRACDHVAEHGGHAYSLGGGFHHALRDRASGFCIFNDLAIGIEHLRKRHRMRKVMYIDIDCHHGDGVQWLFYSDPDVLTLSLHENGHTLFPGTGFVTELGEGRGKGFSVNVPFPMYTSDRPYLYAFEEIVPPLAETFEPDVILVQGGVDTHFSDPLTHLMLTTNAYKVLGARLHELADEHAGGRLVIVGGGGYDCTVVPRAYALLLSGIAETDVKDDIPQEWIEFCRKVLGQEPKHTLLDTERPVSESDEKRIMEEVKGTVKEVKEKVFPYHGLG